MRELGVIIHMLDEYKRACNGPVRESPVLIASPSKEDSGESAHMRRHARVFAARIQNVCMKMKAQTKI